MTLMVPMALMALMVLMALSDTHTHMGTSNIHIDTGNITRMPLHHSHDFSSLAPAPPAPLSLGIHHHEGPEGNSHRAVGGPGSKMQALEALSEAW